MTNIDVERTDQGRPDPLNCSARHGGGVFIVAYGIAAAFSVYFCMYAVRKPFAAIPFPDVHFWGTRVDLKTACVISQSIGYLLSKYLGTKICSEVLPHQRARLLLQLILVATFALFLFAIVPNNWKPLAMLMNGLPLGIVWGVVVRYLEGRRSSEVMLAGLSCSYIIAGAITRDIGRDLVIKTWHVPDFWMPVATAGLFFVPLWLSVQLLDRLPPPNKKDIARRAPRGTMILSERRAFLMHFRLGMFVLLTSYFFLTAFRDFRDQYSAEIFQSMGLADRRAIFSQTEQWAAFATILAAGGLSLFSGHRAAMFATFSVMTAGFALMGLATIAYRSDVLSGYAWMSCLSVGIYLAYVPFGVGLFERLMAGSRLTGTSVFAVQLADGIGYTGSVLIQIYRDLFHGQADRLAFIIPFAEIVSLSGVVLTIFSGILLIRRISN